MTTIEFKDHSTVTLVRSMASDLMICEDARLSTNRGGKPYSEEANQGLVRALVRERHSVPLEAPQFCFEIEAPLFVAREAHRHRNFSISEMSGRYVELMPIFWIPRDSRPLVQVGKAMEYRLEPGTQEQYREARNQIEMLCGRAWASYQLLLEEGVAKEVARVVLPLSTFTRWRVRCSLRSALQFCSLRTRDERAAVVSKPMLEIAEVARKIEEIISDHCPVAVSAWNEAARPAL